MPRPADDLVLSVQRVMDRLVRRVRSGRSAVAVRRRLVIIQIDGLSRVVLDRALASGRMPFVRRLLERHGYRLEAASVGLPTSTPAFQMAAMYGVRPDIPGFHYYDREQRADIHFPRPGHAAAVEDTQATGRRGILTGGSAYGCVFTGGADNDLFSFARLTRPTGRGVLSMLSAVVVVTWVVVKNSLRTALELTRAALRFVADPGTRRGWRWLTIQIGLSVWVRGFFTLAVSRDLYRGTPAIYVNYLDYDVAAHAFGPASRRALGSLRRVDRAIHQIWRVLRRVPEHSYDLYILSDHGQAHSRPYPEIAGGRRLERWIFEKFLDPQSARARNGGTTRGLTGGIRARHRNAPGLIQQFLNYLDEDFLRGEAEAHEQNGVRVISAGPNAFVYVLDTPGPLDVDALEQRFPGFVEELSRAPGVGYVLARSAAGPVCFRGGKRYQLSEADAGPFADRADAALVVSGITDLMAMRNAGDLVIYGTDAPEGHVSYIPEIGAHAGPSPEELHTFVIHHARVAMRSPITHPIQLYEHFIRYHEPSP